MADATLPQIRGFLSTHRIAMVGVSRDPNDFSRKLFKDLGKRGYEVIPVNLNAGMIDEQPCYPRVSSIDGQLDAVLILTPADQTSQVCEDCIAARVPRVWMYCAIGHGAVDPVAAERCRKAGIDVIEGYCPYMFLEDTPWIHRIHGGLLKFLGSYPEVSGASAGGH